MWRFRRKSPSELLAPIRADPDVLGAGQLDDVIDVRQPVLDRGVRVVGDEERHEDDAEVSA